MPHLPDTHPLADAIALFRTALAADRKSARTIEIYCEAATWLACRIAASGADVTGWQDVTRQHVREHFGYLNQHYAAGYVSVQYRSLRRFAEFLASEEGITGLLADVKPPRVVPALVPVIPPADLGKLLAACTGHRFEDVRDTALIRLFASSGARRGEITALKVNDVDMNALACVVTGKGGKPRIIRFDAATALAVQRYLRARRKHKHAGSPYLWVGIDGPLNGNSVYQIMRSRGGKAGVRVHPHQFRHSFAHAWLANGGSEGDLMTQAGWSSRQMLDRYGASARTERAMAAYDRVMNTGRAS